jgi:hypothetical protein
VTGGREREVRERVVNQSYGNKILYAARHDNPGGGIRRCSQIEMAVTLARPSYSGSNRGLVDAVFSL